VRSRAFASELAAANRSIRFFRIGLEYNKSFSKVGLPCEPFRGAGQTRTEYLAKTPGQALHRAGHYRVCEKPRLRQRMLHRQLGEAQEFPAWKDNDQRVPEIDFAPDFELSHG
jgi:hypothetical protein